MASDKKAPPPDDFDIDAPLTDEEIARLRPATEVFAAHGMTMPPKPQRGRPAKPDAKQSVTMRLDPDVLRIWRATGPGWQSRMGEVLSREAERIERKKVR